MGCGLASPKRIVFGSDEQIKLFVLTKGFEMWSVKGSVAPRQQFLYSYLASRESAKCASVAQR